MGGGRRLGLQMGYKIWDLGKKKLKPAEKAFFLGGRGRVGIGSPCWVAHGPPTVQGLTGPEGGSSGA